MARPVSGCQIGRINTGLPKRDIEFRTYADSLNWPDETRSELMDGIAYAMPPAPTRRHQEIALNLVRQIADALGGAICRPNIAPFDVRLPCANESRVESDGRVDTVVQPDISVICDKSKLGERGCS